MSSRRCLCSCHVMSGDSGKTFHAILMVWGGILGGSVVSPPWWGTWTEPWCFLWVLIIHLWLSTFSSCAQGDELQLFPRSLEIMAHLTDWKKNFKEVGGNLPTAIHTNQIPFVKAMFSVKQLIFFSYLQRNIHSTSCCSTEGGTVIEIFSEMSQSVGKSLAEMMWNRSERRERVDDSRIYFLKPIKLQ